ncbi:MAG: hypothetical protein OXE83_04970, partial [Gammaproteobacteria bacterium]|nr:hypothetical protein [Gammaproteobacteria bacterium]
MSGNYAFEMHNFNNKGPLSGAATILRREAGKPNGRVQLDSGERVRKAFRSISFLSVSCPRVETRSSAASVGLLHRSFR